MHQLESEINAAREFLAGEHPAPSNELQTCDWVIVPILQAIGYKRTSILAQGGTETAGRPDYLIKAEQPWLLEAKAWSSPLTVDNARQATGYAYQNSYQWVVLTNGKLWHLYDAFQVEFQRRLVVEFRIESPLFKDFILCLSPGKIDIDRILELKSSAAGIELLGRIASGLDDGVIPVLQAYVKSKSGYEPSPAEIIEHLDLQSQLSAQYSIVDVAPMGPSAEAKDVSEGIEIYINTETVSARGVLHTTGEITVLAGSKGNAIHSVDHRTKYVELRQKYEQLGVLRISGDSCEFTSDLRMKKPSSASQVLFGRSSNGWQEWHDKAGNSISVYKAKDLSPTSA